MFQNRSEQIAPAQIGLSKISLIQTSSTQINFLQTQPPQVDFVPFDIKRGLDQLNSSKVTLPLEVATNQFFWSHLQDYLSTSNQTNPSNGAIALNQDGTVTYTPNATFVGTDTFTDTEGLTSNTATVNNIAPVITVITGDTTTTEGTTASFSGTAVDPGDELTYLIYKL